MHGHDGPVNISLASATTPIDDRVLQTTKELPQLFPFNLDMNSGDPLGAGMLTASHPWPVLIILLCRLHTELHHVRGTEGEFGSFLPPSCPSEAKLGCAHTDSSD